MDENKITIISGILWAITIFCLLVYLPLGISMGISLLGMIYLDYKRSDKIKDE